MAYGWIGTAPGAGPAEAAERAPALVVSAAYSAFGAVRRLQVRVGEVSVLLHPAPPGPPTGGGAAPTTTPPPHHPPPPPPSADRPAGAGALPGPAPDRAPGDGALLRPTDPAWVGGDGWVLGGVVADLDVGAHLAAYLDLAGREDEAAGEPWDGALPVGRYAALRCADPADADGLAAAAGCPAGLVRALADPVALARVEVVRRDGADRATGPAAVGTSELAWVDGGPDGLWTVRPGEPDEVRVGRGTPAGVAAELAGLVRAAEGC